MKRITLVASLAATLTLFAGTAAHAAPGVFHCQADAVVHAGSFGYADIPSGQSGCVESTDSVAGVSFGVAGHTVMVRGAFMEIDTGVNEVTARAGAAEVVIRDAAGRVLYRLAGLNAQAKAGCKAGDYEYADGESEIVTVGSGGFPLTVDSPLRIPTPLGTMNLNHVEEPNIGESEGTARVAAFWLDTPFEDLIIGYAHASYTLNACG